MAAVVLALGAIGTAPAYADDPHDLFGLKPTKPVEEAKPADPLDAASPFGLATRLAPAHLARCPVAHSAVANNGRRATPNNSRTPLIPKRGPLNPASRVPDKSRSTSRIPGFMLRLPKRTLIRLWMSSPVRAAA